MNKIASTVNRVLNKVVFSSLVLIFLCLVSCLGCMFIGPLIPFPPSALEVAAARLGFEPSSVGLAEYINTSIEPGMTGEEVEQILRDIGEVETLHRGETRDSIWGPERCDVLLLEIPGEMPISLGACYDVEGFLISMSSRPHKWNSDPLNIQIPTRQ